MRSERRDAREKPGPREDGERGCVAPVRSLRAASPGTAGSAQATDTATRASSRLPFRRASKKREASKSTSPRPLYLLQGAYLVFLVALFVVSGMGLTPDIIFLLLAVGFVWRGQRWSFVRDFGPFVLLLLSYDAMRGFADDVNTNVHFGYPIAIDKALFFGHVPTVDLQSWLFDPGSSSWYDYPLALLHVAHFIVPLFFAAIIWQHYSRHYWPFVMSLLLVSYAAFVTFLLVPTAPPWLAGLRGELPGVSLVHETLPAFAPVYRITSPNAVAAMPSLHAAYPWLFLLFAWRIWGWRATPFALYPAAVFFMVIYLGHHYVADILGGVIYATGAYVIVCSPAARRLAQRATSLASRLGRRRAAEGDAVGAESVALTPAGESRRKAA
jgi:hypothetical protein